MVMLSFSMVVDVDSKPTKWPHLSSQAKNLKKKGSLFSSILKVQDSKVPLFFDPGWRYGHALIIVGYTLLTWHIQADKVAKNRYLGKN